MKGNGTQEWPGDTGASEDKPVGVGLLFGLSDAEEALWGDWGGDTDSEEETEPAQAAASAPAEKPVTEEAEEPSEFVFGEFGPSEKQREKESFDRRIFYLHYGPEKTAII